MVVKYRGGNPAVRSRVPIIVRIERGTFGGWTFVWYLTRRYGRKRWRAYFAHQNDLREAIRGYRDYAEYWRTGQW